MLVLTASTKNQANLTAIQKESCILCGVSPNEHVAESVPEGYPRHPSWFKIRSIIHHLPHHDYILWMDSDAMMLRPGSWAWFNQAVRWKKFTCALTRDINGFNCGVMVWANTPQSFEFLWRIYDSYEEFDRHPWMEQGSFHTMAESFDVVELPKLVWNAYETDRTDDSLILHLPGKSPIYREAVMQENLEKLRGKK